jgi:hypothetical protein
MGRNQRIGFAALAALIAVVAVLLLSGGSDEATERADAPPPTATPTPRAEAQAEARPTRTATPTPTPRPRPAIRTVRVRDGEVRGGTARLRFEKGETARFAVSSDVADEIHVHGYDLTKDVPAGGTVSFRFRADIDGIFEVEFHDSGLQLAQLRVDP